MMETSKMQNQPECRPPLPSGWEVVDRMSFADANGNDLVVEFIGKRAECEQ
jgi:hypothetical protein